MLKTFEDAKYFYNGKINPSGRILIGGMWPSGYRFNLVTGIATSNRYEFEDTCYFGKFVTPQVGDFIFFPSKEDNNHLDIDESCFSGQGKQVFGVVKDV